MLCPGSVLYWCAIFFLGTLQGVYGRASKRHEFRIVSGRVASISEFPYQVTLERFHHMWCGGSIIRPSIVLSAAHCVKPIPDHTNVPMDEMKIRVANDLSEQGGIIHKIDLIIMHERYGIDPTSNDYDLSLIKVEEPFRLGKRAKMIPLVRPDEEPQAGDMGWVSGFGHQDIIYTGRRGGDTRRNLMAVEVPVVSRRECRKIHENFGNEVSDLMICAGFKSGNRDSCKGDSGGPFVVENKLAGVVAWGEGCGQEGIPGVYTSVAKYRGWIDRNVALLESID